MVILLFSGVIIIPTLGLALGMAKIMQALIETLHGLYRNLHKHFIPIPLCKGKLSITIFN